MEVSSLMSVWSLFVTIVLAPAAESWALVGNVAGPRVVTVETMLCPTLSLFADCILAA